MLLRVFSRRCGEAASDHIQQADQDSSILEPMPRHPCQSRIGLWRDKSLAKEVLYIGLPYLLLLHLCWCDEIPLRKE